MTALLVGDPTIEAMEERSAATEAASPVIALRGVSKRYGDLLAVNSVDFDVAGGEILALLGPSGCGKTTTLRLIAGFEEPDAGEIWLQDEAVAGGGSWRPPERREIGVVFQDFALFPHLSVAGNTRFGLQNLPRRQRSQRVAEVLEMVGLGGLEDRYPHQLSGGQQQRVALARALAPQPALLLLDEPFSNLDAEMRVDVRLEVRQILKDLGTTVVFVTHDQEEAFVFADRVAVMNAGRLEQVGTPEELYNEPATRFVADFVGHGNFIPGIVLDGAVETELGRHIVPNSASPGQTINVLVRPHDLAISRRADGPLTVVERRFLGSEVEYVLALPSGARLISHQPPETGLMVGERVGFEVREENLRAF
ncbi:MAG: ABC transporter ATP-binding protein [Dehalococcoidia bacterium]